MHSLHTDQAFPGFGKDVSHLGRQRQGAFASGYVPLTEPELTIELDVFDAPFAPLIMAEVEFPTEEMANAFQMPDWFLEDVTNDPAYHNSNMSKKTFAE